MRTKLTLRLEAELIERAKAWARSRNMSLSDAVANFFAALPYEEVEPKLNERTRRLVGIALRPTDERPPTDEEVMRDYVDYLEQKYR